MVPFVQIQISDLLAGHDLDLPGLVLRLTAPPGNEVAEMRTGEPPQAVTIRGMGSTMPAELLTDSWQGDSSFNKMPVARRATIASAGDGTPLDTHPPPLSPSLRVPSSPPPPAAPAPPARLHRLGSRGSACQQPTIDRRRRQFGHRVKRYIWIANGLVR
ncbi:hypothetical protein PLESTF_001660200 [Pleodorina starrii]|nr:hypothetical protein PLESTF_001660200 [Pleodorina starrii]